MRGGPIHMQYIYNFYYSSSWRESSRFEYLRGKPSMCWSQRNAFCLGTFEHRSNSWSAYSEYRPKYKEFKKLTLWERFKLLLGKPVTITGKEMNEMKEAGIADDPAPREIYPDQWAEGAAHNRRVQREVV